MRVICNDSIRSQERSDFNKLLLLLETRHSNKTNSYPIQLMGKCIEFPGMNSILVEYKLILINDIQNLKLQPVSDRSHVSLRSPYLFTGLSSWLCNACGTYHCSVASGLPSTTQQFIFYNWFTSFYFASIWNTQLLLPQSCTRHSNVGLTIELTESQFLKNSFV